MMKAVCKNLETTSPIQHTANNELYASLQLEASDRITDMLVVQKANLRWATQNKKQCVFYCQHEHQLGYLNEVFIKEEKSWQTQLLATKKRNNSNR